jgi:hypothetical protein
MADELTVIGILTDAAFDPQCLISLKEVKKAYFDCLQLQPMYGPLIQVMVDARKISSADNFTGEDEFLT